MSDLADVPLRTLKSYTAGEADPKTTILSRITGVCGVSIDEVVDGKSHAGSAEKIAAPSPVDVVLVPRLDVRVSAGFGRQVIPGDMLEPMAFQRAWLRSLGVSPADAEIAWAEGDSMEPTIKDGDMMLLDRGWGRVIDGKIYVFVRDGMVSVKRLHTLALGGLMLMSDNDRYPTQTVTASEINDLRIEARVVWYGRAI